MPLSNFEELVESIGGHMDRDDFEHEITDAIMLAEKRIERDTRRRLRAFEKFVTGTLADVEETLFTKFDTDGSLVAGATKEVRFLIIKTSFHRHVEIVAPEIFMRVREHSTDNSAIVALNTDLGLRMAPKPGVNAYDAIVYTGISPALDATNPTNWLLDNAPDVYYYGALLELQPYIADDQRIAIYIQFYENALRSLKKVDARSRWGGGPLRMYADNAPGASFSRTRGQPAT